tara:strand:- start:699 stop:935 length:237 start_codon:yes stop_codon:yes gene_type:complete
MDIVKKSKVEVRDETLWAVKEALDNSDGFVIHISWIDSEGIVKHYNSQRDFLVEDLGGVKNNVNAFIDSNYQQNVKRG